jgi:glycosyltransferase involved in cell wall biosynthesis
VFLFVGSGQKQRELQAEATRRQLGNIIFKPYQPRQRLNHSITLPDVHLVSLLPALEGYIVPSKLYGALAAGRPVLFIGAKDGEVAEELARFRCGATVDPGDAEQLAGWLLRLSRAPALTEEMGSNARIAFDNNFDQIHALSKWRAVLTNAQYLAGKRLSPRVP